MGVQQAQVFECDYFSCRREVVVPGANETDVPAGWVFVDALRGCNTLGGIFGAEAVVFCGPNHASQWFSETVSPPDASEAGVE